MSSTHVLFRAFGDAYFRHENVRRATFSFLRLIVASLVKSRRGERINCMSDMPRTVTLRIKNWRDFTKVLYVMRGGTWLYRGQENAEWLLQSSLDRELKERPIDVPAESERSSIDLFRANSKLLGYSWESDIDALIAMQHHEAKTRLMDFSTSLMVALFFAFEEQHLKATERAIFAVSFNALCMSDPLRLRYEKYKMADKLRILLSERIKLGRGRSILVEDVDFRKFVSATANDMIRSGCDEEGILPLYTAANNKRQLAQAGVQLMPFSFRPFVENLAVALEIDNIKEIDNPSVVVSDFSHLPIDKVPDQTVFIKMVFDSSMERDAWDILDQANINPFTIYPDLIGLARSLQHNSGRK